MFDPLSVTAVTAFLTAAGTSMASEAGKLAWESVGGVVRRVAGRETPAPTGEAERRAVAEVLVRAAGRDTALAAGLAALMSRRVGPATAVPSLLPAGARHFTDRDGALKALTEEAARKADGRPRIAVVHGEPGIGTSAVVLHWGHREAHRHPDGQLYYDLRGPSLTTSPDPTAVLGHFLCRLGVPADEVPSGLAGRQDRYRELLAERRMLVVLDHAQSAAQVAPLISGAPGVFTVVIARRPFSGLDAVRIPVGPLADKDAVRLLTDLVGKHAVKAARATLPAVLEHCAGSPYALRAAAPHLGTAPVARPEWSPVTAAVDAAYRRLAPDAARLHRLAGLRPWPALGPELAAALAGIETEEAARLLEELAEAQLLEPDGTGRYRYRESVRAHAEAAAQAEEGLGGCAAAVRRALARQLGFAVQADLTALRQRWHLGPRYAELTPGPAETAGEAVAALAQELGNLVETVRTAEEFDDPETVWQCVEALWALQLKAGHNEVLLPALRIGVRAAEAHHPGSRIAGRMHTQLAFALMDLQLDTEAEAELRAAAEADRQAGHRRGQATAVESLGLLRLRQWRYTEALECFEQAVALLREITPGEDGDQDVPRALALLERHQARAHRGLGHFAEAQTQLATALEYFEKNHENYNAARTLTDLAETHLLAGSPAAARPLIDQAATLLRAEQATGHLAHLESLLARCA
ncbi:tetratricopeptide repeat protein [Kitasatospora sp. NPDC002227]|uniref:tetratricopeptide repeat protein n=1 Tax=Kitasatospora sp. NPDC002227 TaxID=3154773 RepID=UPI0033301B8C